MADSAQFLTIDLVGWRDRRGRFGKLTEDTRGLQRDLLEHVSEPILSAVRRESPRARQHAPGAPRFADSWRKRITTTALGVGLVIDNAAPHAPYVFLPTRAHTIAARRAKRLRFESSGGSVVFRRSVRHPGTKGNDVIGRAAQPIAGAIRAELGRSAAKLGGDIRDIWR